MRIRPANLADERELAQVHALQRAAYEVEALWINSRGMAALHESPGDLRRSNESFVIAISGTEITGLIATEPDASHPSTLWISRLAVHPSWFRRGVGRLLVRHVLDSNANIEIRVSTGRDNAASRALYERAGFKLTRETDAPDGTPLVEYRRAGKSTH